MPNRHVLLTRSICDPAATGPKVLASGQDPMVTSLACGPRLTGPVSLSSFPGASRAPGPCSPTLAIRSGPEGPSLVNVLQARSKGQEPQLCCGSVICPGARSHPGTGWQVCPILTILAVFSVKWFLNLGSSPRGFIEAFRLKPVTSFTSK